MMQTLSKSRVFLSRRGAFSVASSLRHQANRMDRFADKSTLAAATAAFDQTVETFPSIVIGPNKSIIPQGSFAEAQAQVCGCTVQRSRTRPLSLYRIGGPNPARRYSCSSLRLASFFVQFLDPDSEAVAELSDGLLRANMGVVAHYYMDVELQGVLTAVQRSHPDLKNRIGIADSLKMGDIAVDMCRTATKEAPVTAVACLGVDFMSESVSAILDRSGFGHVPVYRATSRAIGCSLAESAERDSYQAWLHSAKESAKAALHVVYINTSLETKAVSTSIVPTITCTSSNVLQTILQASAQVGPDLKLLYGPDTYMGENLVSLLRAVLTSTTPDGSKNAWDDARIAAELHPAHTRKTLQQLLDGMDVYPSGNCVVHHMFGSEVVDAVKRNYDDAFVTAHLEVPGEMFEIAMERSMEGRGVVGSTSDILKFITAKVDEAAKNPGSSEPGKRLKFILGTEAGST
jgi:quinolinate synthase